MSNQKGLAIVTGASSGIGYELCKRIAGDGYPLLITARNENGLSALADRLRSAGAEVTASPRELASPDGPFQLIEAARAMGRRVEILVNNAGFGTYGPFAEADLACTLAMMQVNMIALTHLTRLILPQMLERGRGRILNVASIAGFQPGPLMAVYYATKAYVLHFSEALASELRHTGVTVTALCPGPTDTGFKDRAGIGDNWLFRKRRMMDAPQVAKVGYGALMRGQRLVVPGFRNKLLMHAVRFGPRRIVTAVVHLMQQPRKDGRLAGGYGIRSAARANHPSVSNCNSAPPAVPESAVSAGPSTDA
jgi:short-subunit dehydrogenase